MEKIYRWHLRKAILFVEKHADSSELYLEISPNKKENSV